MLRRKLLARLGVLVLGFVFGAIVSIALLQGVLSDLNHLGSEAAALTSGVQDMGDLVAAVFDDQPRRDRDEALARFRAIHAELGAHHVVHEQQPGNDPYGRIGALLAGLDADSETDPATPASLSQNIVELRNVARDFVASEQLRVSRRLRTLIIVLTGAALVMVNVTVVMLLRTATMILRPVSSLVEGSRLLASERFDHRVEVDQDDEFSELARAYNALAGQLAANEQRKVEALQQLAITLNHELNNGINVIELQLRFFDRKAGGDQALAGHLRQIRENLARIAETVASLKDLRRIVVTDYIPGMKMLDLSKCTGGDEGAGKVSGVIGTRSPPWPVRS